MKSVLSTAKYGLRYEVSRVSVQTEASHLIFGEDCVVGPRKRNGISSYPPLPCSQKSSPFTEQVFSFKFVLLVPPLRAPDAHPV